MKSRSNDDVADGGVGGQYLISRKQLEIEQSMEDLAYLLLRPPSKHGTEEYEYQHVPLPLVAQDEPVLNSELAMELVQ